MKHFSQLPLPPEMVQNLQNLGFEEMTAVQRAVIPAALSGRDLIVQAQTGSGKTLAFAIPLLQQLKARSTLPQALVIAPTRELAEQIAETLREVARYRSNTRIATLYGGKPMRAEIESLRHGADIVVGTPGRLIDHLGKATIDLHHIAHVVLDEADRMLDMGFVDAVQKIVDRTSSQRQTLLFSATYSPKIEHLAHALMQHAEKITIETAAQKPDVEEHFVIAGERDRTLLQLLACYRPKSAIIFATTRVTVCAVTQFLQRAGYDALDLQGDLDQPSRQERLIAFANGSATLLVATDLAARGLDIADVEMVINYEMPEKEAHYTHRIGRTARAGKSGVAVSLVHRRYPGAREIGTCDEAGAVARAAMRTIRIMGGKRQKLGKGDIVGALVRDVGIANDKIGKIDILQMRSYVAVERAVFAEALEGLVRKKIKGKKFRAEPL